MQTGGLRRASSAAVRAAVLLLALLALPGRSCGEGEAEPAGSSGSIRFVVDAVSFYRPGGAVYEEVYLLVPNRDLRFEGEPGQVSRANIRVRFRFRSWPLGEDLLDQSMEAVLEKAPEEGEDDLQILQHAFRIPEGSYQLRVTVEDLGTRSFGFFRLFWRHPKRGEALAHFQAKSFAADHLDVSDLEFARRVASVDGSDFSKGASEVLPQPNRLFGALMPVLSFYYEIYDAGEPRDPESGPYWVTHQIVGADGAVLVERLQKLIVPSTSERVRRSDSLAIADLPAGPYDLRVTVEDPWSGQKAVTERRFRVVWKGTDAAVVSREAETGDWNYGDRAADDVLEEMRTLLGQGELELLKSLSPGERGAWIESYWAERDPSPGTAWNELREEHYRRIRVANVRFAALRMKGMETDRGRVYIRYGEPDEIRVGFADQAFVPDSRIGIDGTGQIGETGRSRGGFNVEEKEYEVWTYNERGRILGDRGKVSSGLGLRFVFVDLEGYGNYRLVESSESGEY